MAGETSRLDDSPLYFTTFFTTLFIHKDHNDTTGILEVSGYIQAHF